MLILTKMKRVISQLSFVKSSALVVLSLVLGLVVLATPANASGVNWGAIIQCESGGNPLAQNPHSTASGLYQILDSTWAGYGGYRRAKDAPVSVQTAKAMTLGISAWNASRSCWEGKSGSYIPAASVHHVITPRVPVRPVIKAHALPVERHAPLAVATAGNYTVVSGDTLSGIAFRMKVSGGWRALAEANKLSNPNLIFPGQHLAL